MNTHTYQAESAIVPELPSKPVSRLDAQLAMASFLALSQSVPGTQQEIDKRILQVSQLSSSMLRNPHDPQIQEATVVLNKLVNGLPVYTSRYESGRGPLTDAALAFLGHHENPESWSMIDEETCAFWLCVIFQISPPEWLISNTPRIHTVMKRLKPTSLRMVSIVLCNRPIGMSATPQRRALERACMDILGDLEGSHGLNQARHARSVVRQHHSSNLQEYLETESRIKEGLRQYGPTLQQITNQLMTSDQKTESARHIIAATELMLGGMRAILAGSSAALVMGKVDIAGDIDIFVSHDQRRYEARDSVNNEISQRELANLGCNLIHSISHLTGKPAAQTPLGLLHKSMTRAFMNEQDQQYSLEREMALQVCIPLSVELVINTLTNQPDSHNQQLLEKATTMLFRATDLPQGWLHHDNEALGVQEGTEASSAMTEPADESYGRHELSAWKMDNCQVVFSNTSNTMDIYSGQEEEKLRAMLLRFDIPRHRHALWLEPSGELKHMSLEHLGWLHPDLNWSCDAERIIRSASRGHDVPAILLNAAYQAMQSAQAQEGYGQDTMESGWNDNSNRHTMPARKVDDSQTDYRFIGEGGHIWKISTLYLSTSAYDELIDTYHKGRKERLHRFPDDMSQLEYPSRYIITREILMSHPLRILN